MNLSVGSSLVDSFLLHLSLVHTLVNPESDFVHLLERRWSCIAFRDLVLDYVLQSSIEVRCDGLVVLVGLDY